MEFIDILDESGQPTGESIPRPEIHRQGYWHNVVHIYVFRETSGSFEFLVHLRSKDKESHPNQWDARFGGHVKSGETIEQTVLVELEEEIGLEVKLTDLIEGAKIKWDGGLNRELVSVYFCRFLGDEKDLKFNDGEVQMVKWLKAEKILEEVETDATNWSGGGRSEFEKTIALLKEKIKA